MKRVFAILTAVLLTAGVFLPQQAIAQSPEKMSYQAVIRNSSDELVTEHAVGIQISILQGSASGTPVYVETQTPTTNANGLISIEIGSGAIILGDISTIDWADGPYFIKTETDPSGGTSYSLAGTSQLLSVPYALYAKKADIVSYSTSTASSVTIASGLTSTGEINQLLQLTDVPAGTYAVHFSCPLRNNSTSSLGLNIAWAITINNQTPSFPRDGIATSFIPATGWTASYVFGQSGYKEVTLTATGTIELKIAYYGALASGTVSTIGTTLMRAVKL